MTHVTDPAHHVPSHEPVGDPNRTCLYDGESWPCSAKEIEIKVRAAVAGEIRAAVENDQAYRPKWDRGMLDAARIAEGVDHHGHDSQTHR